MSNNQLAKSTTSMLRRKLTSWTSRAEDPQPFCAFPETFWEYYQDSLSRNHIGDTHSSTLAINTKKYSGSLQAVTTVKSFFTGDLPQPSTSQVILLLKSPFTQGDVVKTFILIRYFQLSDIGYFITNDPYDRMGCRIELVGAENWENVMCYLDALLFSMFANLESFEPILFILNQHSNPLVTQLSGLLRVYVNLLRLGNLITTDITQRICECLMKLGFSEALSHRQQDAAPLFEFLTETLSMPLLTFRVEIQHSGKQDNDDTKYSKERILFVSLPDDDDTELVKPERHHVEGSPPEQYTGQEYSKAKEESTDDAVLLEECLEHYFNNSISVKRELQRRATLDSTSRPFFGGDVPVVTEGVELKAADLTDSSVNRSGNSRADSRSSTPQVRVRTRSSTLSIWSISSVESKPREVMLPAWMLLRLLPFYTDDNDLDGNESIARNSREFANRRPILPICLKRYSFSAGNHLASRSKKRVIIPPVINLPLFVADDQEDAGKENAYGYKLILESAVCHRGTTIESGHFVSAVRKNTHIEDESLDQSLKASWYLYDDMKKSGRVVTKKFHEIFDTEWPYMLFYRLVACDGNMRSTSLILSAVSANASPVAVPKGFRQKYWQEDALSTIPSHTDATEATAVADGTSAISSTISVSDLTSRPIQLINSTTSSIPLPEILPTSSKFVDIRKRYLWYVIDKDKNYYKESVALSKSGSRNLSISFTPQFRRNSQWSEFSNISGLALEEPPLDHTHSDLDKVKKKLETFDNEKSSLLDPKKHDIVDGAVSPVVSEKRHHLHHIFSHDKEDKIAAPSLSKKQYRKKRAEYRKEKCCIT
ncbi:CIC11C00000002005 [Sungouiella intermedia]|uniref:ubiquitinyl hydrolase 1 n=1 Tax=Sungouiella intermedia TaxID=45354 RepID=A0A1L0BV40_9ASCO|nr:CIC11C00000002005 [[Candida] intermedia]